jgi:thiol-disulfide isomerase/thioredoxin
MLKKLFLFAFLLVSFTTACTEKKATLKSSDLGFDNRGLPVVVMYYADWCPYCRKMSPSFDELSQEYKEKAYFKRIDVETPEGLAFSEKFRPDGGGIPYFQFFDSKGKIVGDAIGAIPKDQLIGKMAVSFSLI